MNQNFYNSNSSGFDQLQPLQYSIIHHPHQETSVEILQARENLMETIQTFLKKFDHIPPEEKPMAFLLAEDKFLKIKQAIKEEQNQPEDIQELMLKLLNGLKIYDGILLKQEEQAVQKEQQEQAAQSFLLNWNFPMVDDDDESKGFFDDICDVSFCDNDHFDAEYGLINSLLSRDIPITSPKIDFLSEELAGELDFIDPILPGIDEDDCDEDDFDEEEGEIDIDIFQIENVILREKLLNVNLLIDKIEALKLTPSIPFVLKNPSSSPIPIMDSEFLIEEVDTFLVSEDWIPPSIESDLDSEEDIIFLDNLLNDEPIPEYERFTFDIEPDAPVINNFDELNEDECFDPGGGEIIVS
ncbi:hypothetical protein Tco_0934610 [Tanacetum coccineum]